MRKACGFDQSCACSARFSKLGAVRCIYVNNSEKRPSSADAQLDLKKSSNHSNHNGHHIQWKLSAFTGGIGTCEKRNSAKISSCDHSFSRLHKLRVSIYSPHGVSGIFFKTVDVAFIVRLRNNNSECRRVHTAGRRQEEIATEQIRHAEARLGRTNECLHRAAARLLLSTLLRRTIVQKQAAFSTLKCYSLLDTHVSRLRWSAARRTLQRRRARCLRHSFSHWRQTCFKTMMRQLVLGTKLLSVRMQRVHARTSMHHRWRTWCHYVRTLASRSRILLTLSRRIARRNMTCAWTRWVRWLIHNNAEKLLQRGRQDAKLQSLSLRHNHQKLAERLASIFENKLYSSGTSILVRVIRRYCIRNAFRQWAKEAQMNARTEHVLSKLLCLWNRKRISIFLRRWMTATRQVRRN